MRWALLKGSAAMAAAEPRDLHKNTAGTACLCRVVGNSAGKQSHKGRPPPFNLPCSLMPRRCSANPGRPRREGWQLGPADGSTPEGKSRTLAAEELVRGLGPWSPEAISAHLSLFYGSFFFFSLMRFPSPLLSRVSFS